MWIPILFQLSVPGAFAQDSDGSVSRIIERSSDQALELDRLSDQVSQIEEVLGKEKTAEIFERASIASRRLALEKVSERLRKISDAEAESLLTELGNVYASVGAVSAQRILRNAKRFSRSVREQVAATLEGVETLSDRAAFQRLLAKYDGSFAKMVRSAARNARWDSSEYRIQDPFLVSRAWLSLCGEYEHDPRSMIVMGFFSVLVLPFTVAADLVFFPFQVLYWTGYLVHDLLTTTDEERAEAERKASIAASDRRSEYAKELESVRAELSAKDAEIRKLREQVKGLESGIEPPSIRRD